MAALPKITIELEGELVCVLIRGLWPSFDPYDQRARRNEARRIWDALLKRLRIKLGFENQSEGRPRDSLSHFAAYLKYFDGLSWRQVAEHLCSKKHTHTRDCREKFRKGVENVFKRMKLHASQLLPVTE